MLTHKYYPLFGGAERQLAAQIPLMRAQGVDPIVVTRRHAGLSAYEEVDGTPVYRLPVPGPKVVASLTFTLHAIRLIARLKPDAIHAFSLFSPLTTAILAKGVTGKPVVVKILRGGPLGDIDRMRHKALGMLRLRAFKHVADRFIVISHEIDAELEAVGIPRHKRAWIPNGVDTTRFHPPPPQDKRRLQQQIGLPPGPKAIFTGRLAPEKNVEHLLDVWPAVRAQVPGACLVIVGDGDSRPALEKQAAEGVIFAGQQDDVASFLKASDLFLLPSATEGLSNALLEALATGLPAVVTNVGGAPDLINDGVNGRLVAAGDRAALQDAIISTLRDPDLTARFSQQAQATIQRDYRLSDNVTRHIELYKRVAT